MISPLGTDLGDHKKGRLGKYIDVEAGPEISLSQWKRAASERPAVLFERGSGPSQDEREAELRKLREDRAVGD